MCLTVNGRAHCVLVSVCLWLFFPQTLEQVSSQTKASYIEAEAEYNICKNRFRDKLPSECTVQPIQCSQGRAVCVIPLSVDTHVFLCMLALCVRVRVGYVCTCVGYVCTCVGYVCTCVGYVSTCVHVWGTCMCPHVWGMCVHVWGMCVHVWGIYVHVWGMSTDNCIFCWSCLGAVGSSAGTPSAAVGNNVDFHYGTILFTSRYSSFPSISVQ